EEIDRGTLNRFLAAPASRIGIMNASVAEQAVSTTVQSLIIVGLGLAGGARNPLNWVVQIGRSAVSAHPDWAAIGVRCAGLLVLAVACVAISVATFRSYRKNV